MQKVRRVVSTLHIMRMNHKISQSLKTVKSYMDPGLVFSINIKSKKFNNRKEKKKSQVTYEFWINNVCPQIALWLVEAVLLVISPQILLD